MSNAVGDLNYSLVQVAAIYIKGSSLELDQSQRAIARKNASLFGKILHTAETFVRAPNENSSVVTLTENLKYLQFPSSSTEKCVDTLRNLKSEVHTDDFVHPEHFHKLLNLKWRVDITISSSILSRVLEPNIIMEMQLSNGRKITFELTVSKFHKLRYTVASIIKEMDCMNNRMSTIKV